MSTTLPSAQSSGILAFSVDQARLRACLVDRVDADSRLVGWINVQRSHSAPLTGQLAAVIHRLGTRLGRPLWNRTAQEPFLSSVDPVREPAISYVTAAIAPSAPLRVWIGALSSNLSLAAARHAIGSAPALIVGDTSYANDEPKQLDPNYLAHEFEQRQPDVLLIVGGYDSEGAGTGNAIDSLCALFANALQRFSPAQVPLIIYAGNRWAAELATARLRSLGDSVRVETVSNLQPAPGVDDRAETIRTLHDHHWSLARREPGMMRLTRWLTEPAQVTSLDWSFAQLVQAWRQVKGSRDLHAAYRSEAWRIHVRSTEGRSTVQLAYRPAHSTRLDIPGWPTLTLYSGDLPGEATSLPAGLDLWDQSAMAPLIATIGQVDATAMLQTLQLDLFRQISEKRT